MAFLFVVDAKTLYDDKREPVNVNDWAQDWLD
jgi:hypothetical protein